MPPLKLADRIVRYADLRPCRGAFIDTYFPGSEDKENFQVIGGGVVENPDRHVHIAIAHGFNIGGTRMSPGVVNNQHSHENSEVFLVHRGEFRVRLGPEGEHGEFLIRQGDVISFPTQMFRGFQAVGQAKGHLVSVLGIPAGRVTWAPYVFRRAREMGLILLESGKVVDLRRDELVPDGDLPVAITTDAMLPAYPTVTDSDMASWYVTGDALTAEPGSPLHGNGIEECPVIGEASEAEGLGAGPIPHPHDYQVRRVRLDAGACLAAHTRREVEVLFVHRGALEVSVRGHEAIHLGEGDLFSLPIGAFRSWSNPGPGRTQVHVVRGGRFPEPPVWC